MQTPKLGIMFRREYAPERISDFARQVEAAGFDEVWIVEDCFWASGIVPCVAALAVTQSLSVGLGIMPVTGRNAAFAAMEIATIERLYPGRFQAGFGHGVAEWIEQVGALPRSQLAALRETVQVTQDLLAGELVDFQGQHIHFDQVQLIFPPHQAPPLYLGVRSPKSLFISGQYADGTILAEFAAPAYVRWARQQIQKGQAAAQRKNKHRLTVYAHCVVAPTEQAALDRLRPIAAQVLAHGHVDAQLEPIGWLNELESMRQEGGVQAVQLALPDSWLRQLALVGTVEDCLKGIQQLKAAGADSIVLVPLPDDTEALTSYQPIVDALKKPN